MSLDAVLDGIRACRDCAGELAHEPRPVVRVSAATRLLICGQAPGRRVHESGLPFDDRSGDRLRDWMGIDRATFYGDARIGVAAMAFCFPGTSAKGGDHPPPPRCAARWRAPLLSRLPNVRLTLLVGGHAQRWSLRERAAPTLTETVMRWREFGPKRIPTPHPSWRNIGWLKANPWFETELVPYLRTRVREMLA